MKQNLREYKEHGHSLCLDINDNYKLRIKIISLIVTKSNLQQPGYYMGQSHMFQPL